MRLIHRVGGLDQRAHFAKQREVAVTPLQLQRPKCEPLVYLAEGVFRALALGDVAVVDDDRTDARGVEKVAAARLHPAPPAILVPHADLGNDLATRILHDRGQDVFRPLEVIGMNKLQGIPLEQFAGIVAENPAR